MSHPALDALRPAFDGKVALITGAGAGFGKEFSRAFAESGACVAVSDIDLKAAERVAGALRDEGLRAFPVACDVADADDVDRCVGEVDAEAGGVDILINNAGRHLTKYNQPFSSLTRADIRELMDVNLFGVINGTLACAPVMRRRGGGVIINISSIASYRSANPYGVSKLAVRGLTIAFAKELAGDKIRVNAISPGLIATESALDDLPPAMFENFVNELQCVRRRGEIDDIVAAALYLAGPASSFVTGETLKVSGGYPLWI